MPDDKSFADVVRRKGKPVVLVANKSESRAADAGTWESYELGLGEPISLSAEHGQRHAGAARRHRGGAGVIARWNARKRSGKEGCPLLPVMPGDDIDDPDAEDIPEYDATKPLRIAVVGRPNAGKSTLINSLIGQERLLTGPEGRHYNVIRSRSIGNGAADASSCSTRPASGASRVFRRSSRSFPSPMACARFVSPKVVIIVLDFDHPLRKAGSADR